MEEGGADTPGQVLARLDTTDQALRRDEARAAARRATLEYDRIKRLYENQTVSVQQRDDAEAAALQATARLAQLEKAVADGTVVAPCPGVITTKVREAGEFVNAGLPLVTLSRLDEVWLSLYLPEDRLARVKLGASARVKLDGDPTDYRGTITFVSPEARRLAGPSSESWEAPPCG